ncbi:MAG TPA: hypothetical protein DHN29_23135, partial [Cytophagales bacterium]|nr:hypothetical protein [Cytophagales bacterium]
MKAMIRILLTILLVATINFSFGQCPQSVEVSQTTGATYDGVGNGIYQTVSFSTDVKLSSATFQFMEFFSNWVYAVTYIEIREGAGTGGALLYTSATVTTEVIKYQAVDFTINIPDIDSPLLKAGTTYTIVVKRPPGQQSSLLCHTAGVDAYPNGYSSNTSGGDLYMILKTYDSYADKPSVSGETAICSGPITLSAEATPGYVLQWYKDQTPITGETGTELVVTEGGNYSVASYISGGCGTRSDYHYVAPITYEVLPNDTINIGDSIDIFGIAQDSVGTFQYELVGGKSNGCDSLVEKSLVVNFVPRNDQCGVVFQSSYYYNHLETTGTVSLGSQFTIEGWFKTVGSEVEIVQTSGSEDADIKLTLSGGKPKLDYLGSTNRTYTYNSVVNDNKWHHYAVVQSADKLQLYIDSWLAINKASDGGAITNAQMYLGSTGDYAYRNNQIFSDEFRLWTEPRSAADLYHSMGSNLIGNEDGLYLYYDFNSMVTYVPDLAGSNIGQLKSIYGPYSYSPEGELYNVLHSVNTKYISSGESMVINGVERTTPGWYLDEVLSSTVSGCDSAVYIDLVVDQKNQVINFDSIKPISVNVEYMEIELVAGGESGNKIEYVVADTSIAKVDPQEGLIIYPKSVGTTTVTAYQKGKNGYNSADPVTRELVISPKDGPIESYLIDGYGEDWSYDSEVTMTFYFTAQEQEIVWAISDSSKIEVIDYVYEYDPIYEEGSAEYTYLLKGVGEITIEAYLKGTEDYLEGQHNSYTREIEKRNITAYAYGNQRAYGQPNSLGEFLYYGFSGEADSLNSSDDISAIPGLEGEIILHYAATATPEASAGSTHPIDSFTNTLSSPYFDFNVSLYETVLTITKAPLYVKATDLSRDYSEANPTSLPTEYSGFANGEGVDGSNDISGIGATGSPVVSIAASADVNAEAGTTHALTVDVSGMSSANYEFVADTSGVLTISKRPIEITTTSSSYSKLYGDADPAFDYTVTAGSFVGADGLVGDLSREPGEAAGTYSLTLGSLDGGSNYELSLVPVDLTIDPLAYLTIEAENTSKVFGTADPDLTYSITSGALEAGDELSGSLSRESGEDAGVYAIDQGSLGHPGYMITFVPAELTIDQVDLTVTADNHSKTYGDMDPDLSYTITSGSLVGDDAFTGMLSRSNGEDAGSYYISQGSLTLTPNYNLSFLEGSLTINPKVIIISATNQTKTYGDTDPELTYTITSGELVGADLLTGSISRSAGENVGSYTIGQGSLATTSNYNLIFEDASLTINPRTIAVTADDQTKTYGDADPELTYVIVSGELVGDDVLTGSISRSDGEDVGSYAINQGSLTAGANYELSFTDASFTVTPRAISVKIDDQFKTYGDADQELTYQVTSGALASNDLFSGDLTREAGEDVGEYSISQGSLMVNDNYNLTVDTGILTVDPLSITVAVDAQSKTYGDADPELTYTITTGDLIGDDSFTGVLTREEGENAGSYLIEQGTLALSDNYDLSFVGESLTINPVNLTIAADNQGKAYGEVDPDLTYSITSGALVGDEVLEGALSREVGEDVGSYEINQGTLAASANYSMSFTSGSLDIAPVALVISVHDQIKTYGDSDPELTYSILSGELVGDDGLDGALIREDGEDVGTYSIGQGTLTAGTNYELDLTAAVFTIEEATLIVGVSDVSRSYLEENPEFIISYSGFVNGEDQQSLTNLPIATSLANVNSDAGTYPINVTGGEDDNYEFVYTDGILTISPATQTITF